MKYLPTWWPQATLLVILVAGIALLDHKMKSDWHWLEEAPAVSSVPHTDITPAKVSVYEPAAKAKLYLPKRIQEDPKQHVLTASRVEPSFHAHTVTTLLDEATGASQAVVRVEPYPWIANNPSGSLSLSYGLRNDTPVARLALTQDLIQIKAANLGGVAHLDSDGAYYVGAGVNFRW